jgi:hypothetical protein
MALLVYYCQYATCTGISTTAETRRPAVRKQHNCLVVCWLAVQLRVLAGIDVATCIDALH